MCKTSKHFRAGKIVQKYKNYQILYCTHVYIQSIISKRIIYLFF